MQHQILVLIYTGVILKTTGSTQKTQKRALFHYKTDKKGTLNLPFVYSFFTIILIKQIFEKNKSLRAASGGWTILFKTKIQGQFKVFAYILPRIQGFCAFFKLSNITIITIFLSHDRLSQIYTSMSTLSKMNFIQLYHNARDTHSSTNVYIPVPNVLGLVLTHTQSFPFF